MYSIYCITNKVNRKRYVGQTSRSIQHRWWMHQWKTNNSYEDTFLHRAIRKYGADSFFVLELAAGANKAGANCLEKIWIEKLRSNQREFGYNSTSGGDSDWIPTENFRAKIGAKTRERMKDPQARQAASDKQKGKIPSLESRERMSRAGKGRKKKPATVERMRQYALSRPPEHQAKINAGIRLATIRKRGMLETAFEVGAE